MCGIRLLVLKQQYVGAASLTEEKDSNKANAHEMNNKVCNASNSVPQSLKRRGPDGCGEQYLEHDDCRVVLQASVLQLRDAFVAQPVFETPPFVSWNGELYQQQTLSSSAELDATVSEVWQDDVSDTSLFADAIRSILLEFNDDDDPVRIMKGIAYYCSTLINAEYAFCVVTPTAVYYGRDPLGRRSLLFYHREIIINRSQENFDDGNEDIGSACITFELSSVATDTMRLWEEVSPGMVHGYAWRENRFWAPQPFAVPPFAVSTLPTSAELAALQLMELLEMAVRRRIPLHTGSVAILFSGGLDSVVLAALALKVVPPTFSVLLVNVSFVEIHSSVSDSTGRFSSDAADTQAALLSYQELQQLYPEHSSLQFIPHQVDWNEIQKIETHVRALIHPKDGTMDLNIATALWFAAQAATPARVLLSGLGADEQMGGYGRHRKAWSQNGEEALRKELDLDLQRLWERNLGRDDRVLSDHGTEARYPFLDTNVMSYIAALPLNLVCDFNLPPGQGDKRILRKVAESLGVETASSMVKRAIQFGSRISHVCDKKRFGSRRKATMGASNGSTQPKNLIEHIHV
jgi:asparagine synthetase B (glutamine-hydrolysing)